MRYKFYMLLVKINADCPFMEPKLENSYNHPRILLIDMPFLVALSLKLTRAFPAAKICKGGS